MLLTRHTDYSVRVLMYLALHDSDKVTIAEVARNFTVSRNHLMKIVHRLGRLGYLNTQRGKGGGMSLAKPPESINLSDVVQDMEPTLAIMECNAVPCPIAGSCAVKIALLEARDCFLQALGHYTIADLIKNKKQLLPLLERFLA